jgi:nitrogenase molybdenum-iron protein alpha/beta subunit
VTALQADFSPRIAHPYLVGVLLGINAVPDAYLVVDGPACFPLKTPIIQGNHDWFSELSSVSGRDRCITTGVHPSTVVLPRETETVSAVVRLSGYESAGCVLLTARPMAAITGVDYDRLARIARRTAQKPVLLIPPRSLDSDWLAGYAEVLFALAGAVELDGAAPQPDSVAVVGYLWDRNEGDHEGNLRELQRLLSALGLKLEVTWLSGQPFEQLGKLRKAGAIISLPHGRKAARALATRLGVPLVETVLPLGFAASERFVRDVGGALGREQAAERLIDQELARWVPRLEWVIPFVFQGTRIGFVGDPNHLPGFGEMLEMVGATLSFAALTAQRTELALHRALAEERLWFEPRHKPLQAQIERSMAEEGLDLLVAASVVEYPSGLPVLELGFPSHATHALVPRPFLGFEGTVALFEAMANTMRRAQIGS